MCDFRQRLGADLSSAGLFGDADARAACTVRASERGLAALAEVEQLVGADTMSRALSTRRGARWAETYCYVAGYGELMTEFLSAPVRLQAAATGRIARIGAFANLIVSHFDELVDGGWPRPLLLPRWALALSTSRAGRVLLRVGMNVVPAQTRLIVLLVGEYFRRIAGLPNATRHARARADLRRAIVQMYAEEGRSPREWERRRGSSTLQKKTALPLVVLGQAAWLASNDCTAVRYETHRRWLIRVGKFIRWIDDAADLDEDRSAGASNLVIRALARRPSEGHAARLSAGIARRGRRVLDDWFAMTELPHDAAGDQTVVLATVLTAWIVPERAAHVARASIPPAPVSRTRATGRP